ncbi:F-box and leucine-rich repeat protein 9 [Paragonimus westermani]|uniref:F-box and leucine-rich repeat protein 9 n=1 Tax=Paragonimus westermani TaxID=34504 RepID=A0A5J4NS42_9TREM|nr:F-box and leucine-rich repeat protein 9 [Paragonimus westermani]
MELLPLEVLERIFYFLPTFDQKSTALTCRRLYSAVFRPLFLFQRRFVFREPIERTNFLFENLQKYEEWSHIDSDPRAFKEALPITLPSRPFGAFYWAPFISKVTFANVSPDPYYLTEFLVNCVNLHSLDLNGCNCLFTSSSKGDLPASFLSKAKDRQRLSSTVGRSLRCLSLAHLCTVDDVDFAHVLSTFPLINDLDLSGCFISFGSRELSSHTGGRLPLHSRLSFKTVLKELRSLVSCVCTHDWKAVTLRVNATEIDDDSLCELASANYIHLGGLFLDNCRNLTDHGLLGFLVSQAPFGCLREFSMGFPGPDVTSIAASEILKRVGASLTFLRLSKWPSLPENFCSLLKPCRNINHLDCSLCTVDLNSFSHVLVNFRCLTSLNLSGHCNLSDANVSVLSYCLQHQISYLDISSCMKLTDISLSVICSHFSTCLEVLLANWCKGFSGAGIIGDLGKVDPTGYDIRLLKCLKHLNLSDCHQITGHSLSALSDSPHSFFQNLVSLRLGRISFLTNRIILSISSQAPLLQTFDVSRSELDDQTLEKVSLYLSNHLRYLYVAGCENLTDHSLLTLKIRIPFLRFLDISFCPHICHESLVDFKASMPYLCDIKALYTGSAAV